MLQNEKVSFADGKAENMQLCNQCCQVLTGLHRQ
jgi:hypothetical protein